MISIFNLSQGIARLMFFGRVQVHNTEIVLGAELIKNPFDDKVANGFRIKFVLHYNLDASLGIVRPG